MHTAIDDNWMGMKTIFVKKKKIIELWTDLHSYKMGREANLMINALQKMNYSP